MLIDDFMPAYHFNEVHSMRIYASSDTLFSTIKAVTPREVRLLGTLMWIRSFPARLCGVGKSRSAGTKPILEELAASGFVLLGENGFRELMVGAIGQFWRLRDNACLPIGTAQEFLAFDHPAYAKAVMNFRVENLGGGWSEVTTETRILATHSASRRKFARYWFVIYPGSATIRRSWLQAIKRRAESG